MERQARGSRHASPPHNYKPRNSGPERHDEHLHSRRRDERIRRNDIRTRQRARSLSPSSENLTKALEKHENPMEFSNGSPELYPGYDDFRRPSIEEPRYESRRPSMEASRAGFRKPSMGAGRDDFLRQSRAAGRHERTPSSIQAERDEFRQQSMEPATDEFRPPLTKVARDEFRRPSIEAARDEHRQASLDVRREGFRRASFNVSRQIANPDELTRSILERQNYRTCSPSHHGDGEEDVSQHHLFPVFTNNSGNKIIRTIPELIDRRKINDVFDTYGMLVKKSIVLENGTVETFFTLPPDTSDPLCKPKSYSSNDIIGNRTGVQNSVNNVDFGNVDSIATRYRDSSGCLEADSTHKLPYSRHLYGEVFEKEKREIHLPRSSGYLVSVQQSKTSALDSDPSRISRSSLCGHRDPLHARPEVFHNEKLDDASTSEKHRQGVMYCKESSSMRDMHNKENCSMHCIGNVCIKDIDPCSRRQVDGNEVAAYTENVRRDGSENNLMPHDWYNKGLHCPCPDYVHCPQREECRQYVSARSCLDVRKTDRLENTANLRNQLRVEEDEKVNDYGSMPKSSSVMAISSNLHGEPFSSRRSCLSFVSRMEMSRDTPTRHAREEYPFKKEVSDVDYKETGRNPSPEASVSMHGSNLSPLSRSQLPIKNSDMHGPDKRGMKRKYIDEDRHDLQWSLQAGQLKSRKIQKMDFDEDQQRPQEGTSNYYIHSGRSFHDEGLYRVSDSSSISVHESFDMLTHLPEPQAKISGLPKQTRRNCHHDDNSCHRKQNRDFHRPCNCQGYRSEFNEQDGVWNRYHEKDDSVDDREPVQLSDLPEDSEAFKQQVQRTFLHFVKVFNENPAQRKKYEDKGKSGSLLCIVCGSHSKDFVDTHSLVMHAFNTRKIGLRAKHLGLHKALCVLMGWNYAVAPNNGYAYQKLSEPDTRAMKEDLILWPPLVFIHIASVEKKQDGCEDVISNLEMDDILRGLGFSSGKSNAVDHSSVNHVTFIVKFSPTFSGLQEAERLHKYCEENQHGRNDWLQVQSLHKSQQNVGKDINLWLFYGYIGIAGDLEEVDCGTRKRSFVRSRKEIEAIADGPILAA